jgi:anthranilate phosphoribosyltransferase
MEDGMSASSPTAVNDAAAGLRSVIQRIATGPELSKDISRAEASAAMGQVLNDAADPVQAAIFLIALRMKRETDDENLGVLDALRAATETVTAPVDEVLDLADPYDGYGHTLPVAPFLPALLAACGVPTLSHGIERLAPKFGVTHHQVLRALDIPVDLRPRDAAARLGEPDIGWAYLDQSAFCPKLHALAELRTRIVKRPVLTTVETLLGPVRGRQKTHLITGYVHKAYPRKYALLARAAGFDSALIVRGVEGGVIPMLRQSGKCFAYRDGAAEQPQEFTPTDFGMDDALRAPVVPAELESDKTSIHQGSMAELAIAAAQAGKQALMGTAGPVRDNLICAAALCLTHLGRHPSLRDAAESVRHVIDSGEAWERFDRARTRGSD